MKNAHHSYHGTSNNIRLSIYSFKNLIYFIFPKFEINNLQINTARFTTDTWHLSCWRALQFSIGEPNGTRHRCRMCLLTAVTQFYSERGRLTYWLSLSLFRPGKSSLVVFSVGWLLLLSSQDGSSPPLWRACVINVARQAKLCVYVL